MPQKKKTSRAKISKPKRTAKRRTALPVPSIQTVAKAQAMRLVLPPVAPAEPSHEMVARRAFENWMMHLRLANDPMENWLKAESQLRRELNPE
jgi:hypothetical protein